jgi:hypothetical protein
MEKIFCAETEKAEHELGFAYLEGSGWDAM